MLLTVLFLGPRRRLPTRCGFGLFVRLVCSLTMESGLEGIRWRRSEGFVAGDGDEAGWFAGWLGLVDWA